QVRAFAQRWQLFDRCHVHPALLEGGHHLSGRGTASWLAENKQDRRADADTQGGGDHHVHRQEAANRDLHCCGNCGQPPQTPPPLGQLAVAPPNPGRRPPPPAPPAAARTGVIPPSRATGGTATAMIPFRPVNSSCQVGGWESSSNRCETSTPATRPTTPAMTS